ncbi:hypothetical protein BDW02DRAFT_603466 [Decorospora gaudefroyi]|uniref:Uncharacterized protein n=1 Tax=Decorospora gaudefroyi TaxID=184978 RepID=A0A6A5K1R2_9PLEO|nr:hypothetical protein BDW02DRAFT_603466 [Decorospora gaudefroyi]
MAENADERPVSAPVSKDKTPTIFEEWWAVSDPQYWAQRDTIIRLQSEKQATGPWLYKSDPGELHYFTDVAAFSYETPAILEYNIRGRKEQEEDTVDVSTLMRLVKIAAVESESNGSESEGHARRGDTPYTTPPSSPTCGPLECYSSEREMYKLTAETNRSNAPKSAGTSLDISMKNTQAEDALDKFKRALAKSEIRTSSGSVKDEVFGTEPTPDTQFWSTIQTLQRSVPSKFLLDAQIPAFVPSATFTSPGSPMVNVSYQYPHFFVESTALEQPVTAASSRDNHHGRSNLTNDTPLDECDMRGHCWQKYGLNINSIRVRGIAALGPEIEEVSMQSEKEPSCIGTGEVTGWKVLEGGAQLEICLPPSMNTEVPGRMDGQQAIVSKVQTRDSTPDVMARVKPYAEHISPKKPLGIVPGIGEKTHSASPLRDAEMGNDLNAPRDAWLLPNSRNVKIQPNNQTLPQTPSDPLLHFSIRSPEPIPTVPSFSKGHEPKNTETPKRQTSNVPATLSINKNTRPPTIPPPNRQEIQRPHYQNQTARAHHHQSPPSIFRTGTHKPHHQPPSHRPHPQYFLYTQHLLSELLNVRIG